MIVAKYGVDILGWWTKKSSFAHGLGCWKSILVGLERFKSLVRFEVNNGSRVRFWHDVWCKMWSLGMMPSVIETFLFQEAPMIGKRTTCASSFLETLSKNVVPVGIDNIVWPYKPNSIFTIKSSCQMLYGGGNSSDVYVSIWKVCFFAWATMKGKNPNRGCA